MEDNEYQPDKSGLVSLGGFSYQIKVFAMLATELKEGEKIEFETFDDVAKEHISPNTFDDIIEANIRKKVTAIQVKRTSVSDKIAQGILLNWIQLENSGLNIEKYTLFTDSSYKNNANTLTDIDVDTLIKEIKDSKKTAKSNITKVKNILERIGENELKKIIEQIKSKYSFEDRPIDKSLEQNLKRDFAYSVNQVIFKDRLEEYLQHLTYNIIVNAEKNLPYELTYEENCRIIESIRSSISEKEYTLSFYRFEKLQSMKDLYPGITKWREYKQLSKCLLNEKVIEKKILQEIYYKQIRSKYLESIHKDKIYDIEITSYDNFIDVQQDLTIKKDDTPYNRMSETLKRDNSYANNKQIKEGSCIYLTGDNVDEHQISWSDDDD